MQEQKNNEDTLTDDAIEAGIEELTLALLYLGSSRKSVERGLDF